MQIATAVRSKSTWRFVVQPHAISECKTSHMKREWIAGIWIWSDSKLPRADRVFVGQCLSVVHRSLAIKWSAMDNSVTNVQQWRKLKVSNMGHTESPGRGFTSTEMVVTHTHTHTRKSKGKGSGKNWTWIKWEGNEKCLSVTGTRGRERKRKRKEQTPTQHTWPRVGKPWKGTGRKKTKADKHGTRPEEGGRKRLNQPTAAKFTPIWARTGPTLPRGNMKGPERDQLTNEVPSVQCIFMVRASSRR